MPRIKTKIPTDIPARGNQKERVLFTEVMSHYEMAQEDLDSRLEDFDKKDELYRSHIEKANWPYRSVVFDPRIFTALFEKTARMFANKPKGRLVPREGGDSIGAAIYNELLSFQWDESETVDNKPMLAKWATMDQNARKYGASFALVKWHQERRIRKDEDGKAKSKIFYNGPNFKPLINRDCLPNPSYSTIKKWFQVRDYVTWDELKNINDQARGKPIYKNLDILRDAIKDDLVKRGLTKGDRRDTNWTSKNKAIKGQTDYLGADEVFSTVELITEYRNERWITFAPKHGVVIRDIENPYDHGQIPIVMLKYYEVDDDLYGLSEIEPVERLQRGINALVNQYLDTINQSLYAPLKIRSSGVKMHTIEFGPGKKWIMDDPSSDVMAHDQATTGISEFTSTYSFMVSATLNALGETSQGISGISPFENEKTATEVKDTALTRTARDNFNQIYLAQAIKKQMMFWMTMDRQYLFNTVEGKNFILRVGSKDTIRNLQKLGLGEMRVPDEVEEILSSDELIEERARPGGIRLSSQEFQVPAFPIEMEGELRPKLNLMEGGNEAELYVQEDDLAGYYDYIPDIESMAIPSDTSLNQQKIELIKLAQDEKVMAVLQQEGYKIRYKELLEDYFEDLGLKDAEKYFEKSQGDLNEINQAGAGIAQASQPGGGNVPDQGMGGNLEAMVGGQAQPVLPGPGQI